MKTAIDIINPGICKHKICCKVLSLVSVLCQLKTWQKNNKKNSKIKNTKIKIKCVGGTNFRLMDLSDL